MSERAPDGSPDLAVVIPVLDAEETIGDQLAALADQEWSGSWEVVVADNGCEDGTLEVVAGFGDRLPGLRVVDASGRRGVQHAMNVGIRRARAASVAICDADDVVAEGWLAAIGEALTRHPFVASRHEAELLNPEEVRRSRKNLQSEGLQRLWYPPYLPHAGACGMGFWKSVWRDVDAFDEALPSLADTDFCVKVQQEGIELRFVREAVVHVRYRRESDAIFHQAREWARFNCKLYRRYGSGRLPAGECWRKYLAEGTHLLTILRQRRGQRDLDPALSWRLGWTVGLLEGSLQERVPPVVHGVAPRRAEEAAAPEAPARDPVRRRRRDRRRHRSGTE